MVMPECKLLAALYKEARSWSLTIGRRLMQYMHAPPDIT
jgi:hypothetical protein